MLAAVLLAAFDASVEFVFPHRPGLESVNVCGTFNGWKIGEDPMTLEPGGQRWVVTRAIPAGRHEYKFVLNGREWVLDPANPESATDASGNTNSIIQVSPDGFEAPAFPGDGELTVSALQHLPERDAFAARFEGAEVISARLRVRRGDAARVSLVVNGREVECQPAAEGDYEWWSGRATAPASASYYFVLESGKNRRVFSRAGLREAGASSFRLPSETLYQAPEWAAGALVYQVFPDRFEDGDPANNPAVTAAWDAAPTYSTFHGGDLAGAARRADYLQSLGVDVLYMTPIFQSPANHRYETDDYRRIDERLGGLSDFSNLTSILRERGIGVMLDGVFNHTSTRFPAFQDLVEKGADSGFADWFFPKSFPISLEGPPNYEAWNGFGSMPKLNLQNPEVRTHILDAVRFWHDTAPIAGWRLDVANEVDPDFWREFRQVVKAEDPDAWIVGEHWGQGQPWLRGDQWDSMMGYEFRAATLDLLTQDRLTGPKWVQRMLAVYDSYPAGAADGLMNLIGSHDTPRFLTLAGGDERRLMAAFTLLLTWPGSPMIYYGDELGMEGGPDPANRRGMEWEKARSDNKVLAHVRRLSALRGFLAPRLTRPEPVDAGEGLVAYRLGECTVLVNVQDSPAEARLEGVEFASDLLTPGSTFRAENGQPLTVSLPPLSSRILVPAQIGEPSSTEIHIS